MTECPGPQPEVGKEVNVALATDLEWHLSPAHPHQFCGGCGSDAEQCHPGRCCTDVSDLLNFSEGVCDLCPTRYDTGQAKRPS